MNDGRFLPARELLVYVQRPGGTRERLEQLLCAVRDMAESLPEDTDGDTSSDVDAPDQDVNGVLNLLVTNLPFLSVQAAQQLALVIVDLIETVWFLDHVSFDEAVWYCRFGYDCHWGARLTIALDELAGHGAR